MSNYNPRETFEKITGQKISRWDGVYNPDYIEHLEELIKLMLEAIGEIKDLHSHPDYTCDEKAVLNICNKTIEQITQKKIEEVIK